jgi:sugar lactone lactonase YvrE
MSSDTQAFAFPGHDAGDFAPVPSRIVTTWPAGHFAENLAVTSEGLVYVSLHSHQRIDIIDPATGHTKPFATLPTPVAGLALDRNGTLWVTGGVLGQTPGRIWRVDAGGAVQDWLEIPDAVFLNGATPHPDGRHILVAESVTGRLLSIDIVSPGVSTWLEDERLKPTSEGIPGANGVKFFGGHIHVSVTGSDSLYRAPLAADGSCGKLAEWATHLRADDFAFDVNGGAYIATHPAHSVLRLAPDGTRTTLAGPAQGAVGSTAAAFGRAAGDMQALYVTTTGGLWSPYEGQVQPAKLLRLELAVAGHPLIA